MKYNRKEHDMKKTILRVTEIAVIATLLCIGCSDDDKKTDWNGEADGFIGRMSGTSFYSLTTEVSPAGGGTVSYSPLKTSYPLGETSYPSGEKVTVTATAASGYYVFKGWSGDSTSTKTTMTVTMNKNKTLTANFEDTRRASVYFDGNGATVGVPEAKNVLKGTVITLPGQGSMAITDSIFIGWNTSRDGKGTNYAADTSYTVTNNVTLYAKWATIKRTVTYSGDIATSGVPKSVTVDSGTVITLSGQGSMARTGYAFVGWNTNSSGRGTDYAANSSYTVTSNVTLYAKWTKKPTVTYNGNGTMDGIPQPVTVDSGTVITLPSQGSMVRTDYNFVGWNTSNSGSGTDYAANSSYTVTNNVTLYAKWTVVSTPGESFSYGGQEYKTVKIGSQTWMAENLNYQPASGNSWCHGNDESNCNTYGRLYDWATAMDIDASYNNESWGGGNVGHRGVCPVGWHLSSDREWTILMVAMDRNSDEQGKKLKSKSGWSNGTDDYGFSALPGGSRDSDGSFRDIGFRGYWWTATENGGSNAYYRSINDGSASVYSNRNDKIDGFSVRCLKDD